MNTDKVRNDIKQMVLELCKLCYDYEDERRINNTMDLLEARLDMLQIMAGIQAVDEYGASIGTKKGGPR